MDTPKRPESGLKPSKTVGKQLHPLILHLYGNEWPVQSSETGLKPFESVGKQLYLLIPQNYLEITGHCNEV